MLKRQWLHSPPDNLIGRICILNCKASAFTINGPREHKNTRITNSVNINRITDPSLPNSDALDLITAKTYLTSALSQFLGLSGTAIPIDILKLQFEETPVAGNSAKLKVRNTLWVRVPHDDAAAVVAAVSSWIGGNNGSAAWKIRGRSSYLAALTGGTGAELFA